MRRARCLASASGVLICVRLALRNRSSKFFKETVPSSVTRAVARSWALRVQLKFDKIGEDEVIKVFDEPFVLCFGMTCEGIKVPAVCFCLNITNWK